MEEVKPVELDLFCWTRTRQHDVYNIPHAIEDRRQKCILSMFMYT